MLFIFVFSFKSSISHLEKHNGLSNLKEEESGWTKGGCIKHKCFESLTKRLSRKAHFNTRLWVEKQAFLLLLEHLNLRWLKAVKSSICILKSLYRDMLSDLECDYRTRMCRLPASLPWRVYQDICKIYTCSCATAGLSIRHRLLTAQRYHSIWSSPKEKQTSGILRSL